MDFGRFSFENTSQSYVAFDNINFQTIVIAPNLTEPDDHWMKVTKVSATTIQYWEFSVKHLDEIAIALVILKKPSREKFCRVANLQASLKVIRNRLLQVISCYIHDIHYIHDISWKFKFENSKISSLVKKFVCSKGFLEIYFFPRYFQNILPKHSRMLTEKNTLFNDICLKPMTTFCEIVIIFLKYTKQ